jgi:hypothetical protein
MSLTAAPSIDDICIRGTVKDTDILALRRLIYGKPSIEAADIETLFRINEATHLQDAAWASFFIEAATDYVVNEMPPAGYVTAANAGWLMERIAKDGRVDSATEIELLVAILDKARWSPESLARFTLDQVKHAVIEGEGPLRAGKRLAKGQISADEVDLIRRVLYAFGGDGNVAITRAEAEVLFDIEDATAEGSQAPEWQDLFVKAIASVVMAASGYAVPSRTEALRQEQWSASRGELSIGNMLSNAFSSYDSQTAEERALARLERQRIEIITNEEVSEPEAAWLANRIKRDGRTTNNELLLLAFLKRESPRIHPALQALVDQTTRAA